MELPQEIEFLLSVIGQIDEQYQEDGDLGIDDVAKILLIPLQDKLGVDITLFFEWLSLTRRILGETKGIKGTSILDKRFKELEESLPKGE